MGCCAKRQADPNGENSKIATTKDLRSEIGDKTTVRSTRTNKKRLAMTIIPRRKFRGFTLTDWNSKRFKPRGSHSANPTPRNFPSSSNKRVFKKFSKIPLRQHYSTIKKRLYGSTEHISLVYDKRTGVKKIIKEIKKSTIPETIYDDYISEIQNFLCLDHPNIVKLYEVYELGQSLFLVYEYLSGIDLADKINHEVIGYSLACSIMRDILSGLSHCHKKGAIHLGIDFGKIYINSWEGNISKLLGFVYPWEIEKKVRENKVSCYLAPEVLDGDCSQPNSDIWSLGVILYTIVQGKSPFKGEKIAELKEEYTKIIDFEGKNWEYTGNDLKDLLKKMLEYDYEIRITAEEALNHPWIKNSQSSISTQIFKSAA